MQPLRNSYTTPTLLRGQEDEACKKGIVAADIPDKMSGVDSLISLVRERSLHSAEETYNGNFSEVW